MDYNWLEQNPSSVSAIPTYSPDFGFLQSMQMRANQQYDQGLQKVAGSYSLFNQPVTGQAMSQRQRDYARQAQDQMKDVSAADLSDPKNVMKAENILAPFWQDKDLLTNISGTKSTYNNIQTIQSGLLSKDEKERDMYNPIQVQDQQDYLSELAAAGTDHDKLSQVQTRTIAPFTNLTKLWNESAKNQKLEIKYEEGTGSPYLVSTEGGKQSIPGFTTWARGQLGPETEGMFQTIGRVAANHARRQVLQANPSLTGDAVNSAIADYTYDKQKTSFENNLATYATDIASIDKRMKEIEARSPKDKNGNAKPTENDFSIYKQLMRNKLDYKEYQDDQQYKYQSFITDKDSALKRIATDPQEAFSQLEKDNRVSTWATGRAAISSQEIKKNDAYFSQWQQTSVDRAERWKEKKETQDIINERARLGIESDKDYATAVANGLMKDPNTGLWVHDPNYTGGSGTTSNVGVNINSGTIDADNTKPLHEQNPYESFKTNVIDAGVRDVNDAIFGVQGVAGSIIDKPYAIKKDDGSTSYSGKLTTEDINTGHNAIQRKWKDPSYSYNAQEVTALQRQAAVTGAKNINDPSDMKNALESYIGKQEYDQNGSPNIVSINRANSLANADKLLEHSKAIVNELNSAIKSRLLSDPVKYKNVLVNGQLATPENMAPDFPSIGLRDGTILSPVDVARYWTKGIPINNIPGYDRVVADPVSSKMEYGDYKADYVTMGSVGYATGKYGSPKQFVNTYKDAQDEVMKNTPAAISSSGLRGFSQSYYRENTAQKPVIDATAQALSNASNHILISGVATNGQIEQLPKDDKDVQLLHTLLREGSKYVTATISRPYAGTASGPAVQVTFSANDMPANTDEAKQWQKFITKYPSVIMDIDPNSKNTVIKGMIGSAGSTAYSDMTTGVKYTANPVMKAHGFNYSVSVIGQPDPVTNRYRSFAVSGTYGYVNPETGKMEERELKNPDGTPILGSFSSTTPYAIIQSRNRDFVDILKQNQANYERYKAKDHNTPTFKQIEQSFQNQ